MKFVNWIILFLTLTSTIACKKAELAHVYELGEKLAQNLNNEFGVNTFSVVKASETQEGFAILKNGGFWAINVEKYDLDLTHAQNKAAGNLINTYFLVDNGNGTYTCKHPCHSIGGINMTGWVFEESAASPKDLEKISAIAEIVQKQNLSETLKAKYGLSADRSKELSNLYFNVKRIQNKRDLTDREINLVAKNALGIEVKKLEESLREGDISSMNDLIDQAAETNGVSPEEINLILSDLFQ